MVLDVLLVIWGCMLMMLLRVVLGRFMNKRLRLYVKDTHLVVGRVRRKRLLFIVVVR